MRLKVIAKDGKTFKEMKEDLKKKLPKNVVNQITFASYTDEGGEREKGCARITLRAKDIFDSGEMDLVETIKRINGYDIECIELYSKSFFDLHKIETTEKENFNKTLKIITERKKPMYIKKDKKNVNTWWIGLNKFSVNNVDEFKNVRKQIFVVGHGLGLVSKDFTVNL